MHVQVFFFNYFHVLTCKSLYWNEKINLSFYVKYESQQFYGMLLVCYVILAFGIHNTGLRIFFVDFLILIFTGYKERDHKQIRKVL